MAKLFGLRRCECGHFYYRHDEIYACLHLGCACQGWKEAKDDQVANRPGSNQSVTFIWR